ncbi:response regulator transcription factor [Peptacetobacter hiranonis]|uniref:LytR/AlgR family response regulator transcription factor n=1 Tax=Peptacetobacter hiranonis TaxID=89152 RepID=UPI0019174937|nr:LytTR family DNA-binding domain-containing protein [Peptacetobacter hiranonis]MEE0249397.1 LytTR family DNA-binding domain-containing protein [Peptacetobacter hiranonis]QQQ86642.1 response regulator transcription factor [Peptacetobacter hiranonis]
MFKIVICEDEILQREKLKEYIQKIFYEYKEEIEIIEFESAEDLLSSGVILKEVDIFLLDIKMNGLSGMDLAKLIRKESDRSEIIFVTSLVEYVQDGYTVRAYRYLIKPIEYKELKKHLLNCISDIKKKKGNFIIENRDGMRRILVKEITYIEVRKKELTIHTVDSTYYTQGSLDKIEQDFEKYNFYRCHKSYLINMEYINSINKHSVYIREEEISVSRYRMKGLKTKFTYMLGDIVS